MWFLFRCNRSELSSRSRFPSSRKIKPNFYSSGTTPNAVLPRILPRLQQRVLAAQDTSFSDTRVRTLRPSGAAKTSQCHLNPPPQPPQTFFHDGAHEPFTHRGNCVVVEQQQQRRFLRRGTKHCGPCVRVFVCARPRVWSGGKSDAVKWTTLPRFSFSIAPLPPCWLCLLLFLLFLLGLICRSQCLL